MYIRDPLRRLDMPSLLGSSKRQLRRGVGSVLAWLVLLVCCPRLPGPRAVPNRVSSENCPPLQVTAAVRADLGVYERGGLRAVLRKAEKPAELPLPDDCWLRDARLPSATRLSVIGNIEGQPKIRFPGTKDRIETERFLYYDGLVPTPDFLRCEKAGKTL